MAIVEVPRRQTIEDPDEVRDFLTARGIAWERWSADLPLPESPKPDDILQVYDPFLKPLMASGGYAKADVLQVTPELEDLDAVRFKFLREHTHSEDEVRFFIDGKGLFWFNPKGDGSDVFVVCCGAGDVLSVPAGMPHWFDMGAAPRYTVIRVFGTSAGWTPVYTQSGIDARFNRPYYQVL